MRIPTPRSQTTRPPDDDKEVDMARYLIVAHETVTNAQLHDQVRAVARQDEQAEFVLLVPATPVRHLLFRRGNDEDARTVARRLADKAAAMFAREGINLVEAKVGPESPLDAVEEEVRAYPDYAGFVISTLPREKSRWLRMDLPRQIEARYGRPVYHVLATQEWSAGDLP
jgi:hypothetical protein